MKKKINYTKSSGNIFKDLGFSNPQEMLAKVDLAIQINELITLKKLNQAQAASLLDIDQPKISALSKGKLAGFSIERLFRFLNILGQDITIKISPRKPKSKANVNVTSHKVKKLSSIKPSLNTDYSTISRKSASARKKSRN